MEKLTYSGRAIQRNRRIDALDGISVEKYMTPRVYRISVNLAHQPLDDVRVRQAISYAIDRDDIVEHVLTM